MAIVSHVDRTSVPFSGDELRSIFGLDPVDLANAAAIEALQAELSRQKARERRSRFRVVDE
jgi:hypothetical protein